MRKILIYLFVFVFLPQTIFGNNTSVNGVFEKIISMAKSGQENYVEMQNFIPENFSASDYAELIISIRNSGYDLEDLGDNGLNWTISAVNYSLYKLSKIEGGDISLINLLKNPDLIWDGSWALTLCDAIVKRGENMLPLLRKVTVRKNLTNTCIKNIEAGFNSAI